MSTTKNDRRNKNARIKANIGRSKVERGVAVKTMDWADCTSSNVAGTNAIGTFKGCVVQKIGYKQKDKPDQKVYVKGYTKYIRDV